MKEIVAYRKSLCYNLAREWEWSCPVWFGPGLFADAFIKGTKAFKTKTEAVKDMNRSIKLFGITRKTPIA